MDEPKGRARARLNMRLTERELARLREMAAENGESVTQTVLVRTVYSDAPMTEGRTELRRIADSLAELNRGLVQIEGISQNLAANSRSIAAQNAARELRGLVDSLSSEARIVLIDASEAVHRTSIRRR